MLSLVSKTFRKSSMAVGVSLALVALSGCNGGSNGGVTVSPTPNDADVNPWIKANGSWVQNGYAQALDVQSDVVKVYQYSSAACFEVDSFDFAQGLSRFSSVNHSNEALELVSDGADTQYLSSQDLPESCETPLVVDSQASAELVFEALWHGLNDYYAHFDALGVNWQQIYEQFRPQVSETTSTDELQAVVAQVIAQLNDASVDVDTGELVIRGQNLVPLHQAAKAMVANSMAYGESLSFADALHQLDQLYQQIQQTYVSADSWQQTPAEGVADIAWGKTPENVGLLVINHLADDWTEVETQITTALSELAEVDGLILDVRNLLSDDIEATAKLANYFVTSDATSYHYQAANNNGQGLEHNAQVEANPQAYGRNTYVITSQATTAAAENLVLALQSQAHVKVVGESTAGAIGEPLVLTLPNGWLLSMANEVATTAQGEMLSISGITPDISAPAYTQTSTREAKFESYQRALQDMEKSQPVAINIEDYESQINQLMAQGLIPGAAVAVVKGGEIVYQQGFGRADDNERAVTPDTPFFVASVSKTLLGTTIAQAEAHGLLSIEDEAQSGLDFDVSYPLHQDFAPTLKHLVTHTAGFADDSMISLCTYYFSDDASSMANWFFGQPVCPEYINPSLSVHLQQYFNVEGPYYRETSFTSSYGLAPGEVNRYSNYGAALAASSVEGITGKSLVELTNEYVVNPLGMNNTLWSVEGIPVDAARRYMVTPQGVAVPLRDYLSITYPDGGAVSTAHDLAKYIAAAMNGGEYQGEQVLDADAVAKMTSNQSDVPSTDGVGYFWRLDGDYVSHNGGDFGVLADIWADKHHDVAVVLLTNGDVLHSPAIASMVAMFATTKTFAYGL